ncbi:helix-turn-helix transcriptional regulator [Pseudomonas sp. GV071]|jgi:ArsR family transcriptional regulator|uniref:ArsR/SmtB family transcription factor n=1 Tax=Pseudomonas sp. GV071 TaxID=2135754 RepID=UPI000D382FB8|nr:helix-turn-helix domain-containing protein [Pseudomonas sp. GV071]PTQ66750.1 ArsR family transcriptional regulator [Pseudomonas sp. GV071]
MKADVDVLLKALASPMRRQILGWLRDPEKHFPQQEHAFLLGVCAGQIERKCQLAQSTVSGHLTTLQSAGLLTCQKLGQIHFFKRREDTIAELARTMEMRL